MSRVRKRFGSGSEVPTAPSVRFGSALPPYGGDPYALPNRTGNGLAPPAAAAGRTPRCPGGGRGVLPTAAAGNQGGVLALVASGFWACADFRRPSTQPRAVNRRRPHPHPHHTSKEDSP